MIKKLRLKFIFVATLAYLLVISAVVGGINAWNYSSVKKRADETLNFIVGTAQRDPKDADLPLAKTPADNQPKPPDNANGGRGDFSPETRYFIVKIGADGTYEASVDKISSVDESQAVSFAQKVFSQNKTKGFYGDYRFLISKTDGAIVAFLDCSRELSTFTDFLKISVLIGLCSLIVVGLLVVLFSGLVVRPVQKNYAAQKRFITDANHELKTPLTVIGASCDVLEMQSGENEWVSNIRAQVKRLTALTEQLVLLAKVEEDDSRIVFADFSLTEVAQSAVEGYKASAISLNKKFNADIAKNVTVCGNVNMIERLFSLLLDNAFKYSDENGEINLTVKRKGRNAEIILENSTDGVPRGDLSALFERFYRPDDSRSKNTGGFGIGLSTACAVVEKHGGKISAYSKDGKKIVFDVII